MVKRLATSPHDPIGITDSACKNQSVMVSVQYGPINTYIPIRSTTIGKSRVARDPITMHTSWRSNSDIAYVTRRALNPRQRSIDSYMHRDLTQSRHLMTPTKSVFFEGNDEVVRQSCSEISWRAGVSQSPARILVRSLDRKEKLVNLKENFSIEVYYAGTSVYFEINEYHSSRRYITSEMWGYEKGRRRSYFWFWCTGAGVVVKRFPKQWSPRCGRSDLTFF
ncbi:hypothetical protein F511_33220 [Dorcoceras hygrometricum]|uniref:Factor of DNA methylation 1-5/IDN2 domain-containing protein n=1 Tax=Dorcoceras hygrometricum TaxID=472368 RepID=A0A2Z7CZU9_9LAMI|nr:hypothetical protein F511_33220 [Dorcoceras hygrometricum]